MAEAIDALAGWIKIGLVLAGVFGTNVLTNGVHYNQRTAPAEASAASRNTYGQQMEGRYFSCLDRYEGAVEDHAEFAESHEARLQVCMMRLDNAEKQLRDCRAGR